MGYFVFPSFQSFWKNEHDTQKMKHIILNDEEEENIRQRIFCLFKLFFFLSFSLASTKILLVTIIQNKRNEKKIIFWGVLFPYFFNKLTEELREETFETKFYLNFEGEWLQNPCSLQSGH